MRRFDLNLPCLVCVVEPERTDSEGLFRMETRNISTEGAYLVGPARLPRGTRMEIEVIVRRPTEGDERPDGSCISLRGEVVRNDAAGMAVDFDNRYQISRISRLIAHSQAKAHWMETLSRKVFGPVAAVSQRLKTTSDAEDMAGGSARPMDDPAEMAPVI